MGRKRTRGRKHFYFCIASLIFVSISGCGLLKETMQRREATESLLRGHKLFTQGDYEGSIKETQRALSMSNGKPPGDEALFNLGLTYAHTGHAKRDYRKALDLFSKLTKEYPKSYWVEQANIWEGMLKESERLNQVFEGLKEENQSLNQALQELTDQTDKLNRVFKELQDENERLYQAFRELKDENERLNHAFKALKQVDIEIEKKKREKER